MKTIKSVILITTLFAMQSVQPMMVKVFGKDIIAMIPKEFAIRHNKLLGEISRKAFAAGIKALIETRKNSATPIELFLSCQNLSTMPTELQYFAPLKKLGLYHNTLTPAVIKNICDCLQGLEELNVGNNGLTELPIEISKLTNLKVLDIDGNHFEFEELADIFCWLPRSVEKLILSCSHLTEIPEQIGMLSPTLKYLNLYGNQLSPETREQIRRWLPNTEIKF